MPQIIDRLRRRPLIHLWGPVFLWMAVISFFSSRSSLPPPFSSTCRHSPFFWGRCTLWGIRLPVGPALPCTYSRRAKRRQERKPRGRRSVSVGSQPGV